MNKRAARFLIYVMIISSAPVALVVDDNPVVLLTMADILTVAGFRSLEAKSGDEASVILDAIGITITLLFTDVQMPGTCDGLALAIYAAEHWPEIEIVIVSGRIGLSDNEMPVGATFVPKPFTANGIWSHLQAHMPLEKQPNELRSEA